MPWLYIAEAPAAKNNTNKNTDNRPERRAGLREKERELHSNIKHLLGYLAYEIADLAAFGNPEGCSEFCNPHAKLELTIPPDSNRIIRKQLSLLLHISVPKMASQSRIFSRSLHISMENRILSGLSWIISGELVIQDGLT